MMITPTDIHVAADRRQDLLATAARERRAAPVAAPALLWHTLAIRAVAFVAALLSVRG
jgi:hypothetical protein